MLENFEFPIIVGIVVLAVLMTFLYPKTLESFSSKVNQVVGSKELPQIMSIEKQTELLSKDIAEIYAEVSS